MSIRSGQYSIKQIHDGVPCRHCRGSLKSWAALFQEAADFATTLGPERLISISHSQTGVEGIVTVWYWGRPEACHKCGYNLTGNESGVCPECGARQAWEASARP